ncbi:hypothetical protein NPIL_454821 [Nephila pilipes]|uniref:Uncharacterized protein n=1 Tax=Nephila pilipes TaxID=299642 RepID=A0A8X6TM73_NEPPI|nr:hypothetical protein NPIL_454821 [Nephila pilipes]
MASLFPPIRERQTSWTADLEKTSDSGYSQEQREFLPLFQTYDQIPLKTHLKSFQRKSPMNKILRKYSPFQIYTQVVEKLMRIRYENYIYLMSMLMHSRIDKETDDPVSYQSCLRCENDNE